MYDVTSAIASLGRHSRYASRAVDQLDVELRLKDSKDIPSEDEIDAEASLDYHLRQIYRILLTTFYALELDQIADELKREFSAFKRIVELQYEGSINELVSEPLALLESYIALLEPFMPKKKTREEPVELAWNLKLLARILRGTPKVIYDRKLEPGNEAEVRKAIYDTLIHSFPDLTGEFSIPKPIRSFKPDFGIPSLHAAIEYKFANSDLEIRSIIGSLFEDMVGYSGTKDWLRFFAVIYMTESFVTEDQILSNFGKGRLAEHWSIIAVTGAGKRRKSLAEAREKQLHNRAP